MPRINPLPRSIDNTNAPDSGPTGHDFETTQITAQDLAAGVCIISDEYQGGTQTVQAVIADHYNKNDELFFAISERSAYERVQLDAKGKSFNKRPVYSVRPTDVIDDIAADIIANALARREINLEYPISQKTQETYAGEIRRLSDAIIRSGADDFTIAIDNADSAAKRKRHGFDSEMIRALADLISRQNPVTGFLYSSAGPGNAIIEALRRCNVPVGKQITSRDAILGFGALTTQDVVEQWNRGRKGSHRDTANNHAWKYDRNDPTRRPALLNIKQESGILDPNGKTPPEHRVVQELRKEIAKAQKKAAQKRASEKSRYATRTVARRSVNVATPSAKRTSLGSKRSFLLQNRKDHAEELNGIPQYVMLAAVTRSTARRRQVGSRIVVDASVIAKLVKDPKVLALGRQANTLRQRGAITNSMGMNIALDLMNADCAVTTAAYISSFHNTAPSDSPAGMVMAALNDPERRLTQHQIADTMLQGYIAHRAGIKVEAFRRNTFLPALGEISAPANDREPLAIAV